ncbi:hypothetical protein HYW67_04180 [Candidatus Parcubacteria bacterium]|nr:hypothetical protein [Candidatus Parcubacteria bacterium]
MDFSADPQLRRKRVKLAIFASVILAVAAIGLTTWVRFRQKSPPPAPALNTDEQPNTQAPTAVLSWVGKISALEPNAIVMESMELPGQPRRRALITSTTLITKLTFAPNLENGQKTFIPQEIPITISQLARGQMVEVTSQTDLAGSDTAEFTAVQIRVLP